MSDRPQKTTWAIAKTIARISETKEEIAYWKRQKALRENHLARVQAGARVLLWESQLRILEDKLSALQANLKSTAV